MLYWEWRTLATVRKPMTALRARLFKGEGEATARPARTTVRSWEALNCMFAVDGCR